MEPFYNSEQNCFPNPVILLAKLTLVYAVYKTKHAMVERVFLTFTFNQYYCMFKIRLKSLNYPYTLEEYSIVTEVYALLLRIFEKVFISVTNVSHSAVLTEINLDIDVTQLYIEYKYNKDH